LLGAEGIGHHRPARPQRFLVADGRVARGLVLDLARFFGTARLAEWARLVGRRF